MQNQINKNLSFVDGFTEVVEEEGLEDDGNFNIRRRNGRFKLIMDKNEFNKKSKRNRSTDTLFDKGELGTKIPALDNICGDVCEDQEEEASDSSAEYQQKISKNQSKN